MTAGADEPRFTPGEARQQQALTTAPFQRWFLPGGGTWLEFHRQGAAYLLRFPGLGDFEVSPDGRAVRAWPETGVDRITVEHLFRNQVLPLALSRQGGLVLHASAVEADGRAVAFIGASGRGKSTLAAAFAKAGQRFLTDDGLQLQWRGDVPWALPSHAAIRLWADSEQALLGPGHPSAPALGYTAKGRFLADGDLPHRSEALPLGRIYLLGDGSAAGVHMRAAAPQEAVRGLVSHSFLLDIDEETLLARHFDDVTRLAALGLAYHLDYPRRYEALAEVRAAIVRHAGNTSPA